MLQDMELKPQPDIFLILQGLSYEISSPDNMFSNPSTFFLSLLVLLVA